MDIIAFVKAVVSDDLTNYVIALLFLFGFADLILGTLRALSGGTFKLELWDTWVRASLAGRIGPLTIVLLLGRIVTVAAPKALVIPGIDLSILTAGGIAAAVPYLFSTLKSIIDSVNPSEPDRLPRAE